MEFILGTIFILLALVIVISGISSLFKPKTIDKETFLKNSRESIEKEVNQKMAELDTRLEKIASGEIHALNIHAFTPVQWAER